MNNNEIKTGDRVLCKVGDFPPWPAVVVPQRFLSKMVYSGKRSKNYVCVAFFNDDSYYWKEPRHLTLLTDEMCSEWMKKSAQSHDDALVGAYEQAIEYHALFDFLKERLIREEREEIIEDVEDIPAGEDPFEPKPSSRKGASGKSSLSKKRAKSLSGPQSVDSSSFSNPGVDQPEPVNDDTISQSTPVSRSPSLSSSSVRSTANYKKRKLDYENRVNIAQLLRNKLQRNLVQRNGPPTEREHLESNRLFKTITNKLSSDPPFFDYKALSASKLYKLLKVISHDNNLSQYHGDCENILQQWSPIISQIKKDKQREQQAEDIKGSATSSNSKTLVSDFKVEDAPVPIPK